MNEKEIEYCFSECFKILKQQTIVLNKISDHIQNMSVVLKSISGNCTCIDCDNIPVWENTATNKKVCDRHYYEEVLRNEENKKCWEESQHSESIRGFEELFLFFLKTKNKH